MKNSKDILTPRAAMLWILITTILVSGSAALGLFYYQHVRILRIQDDKFNIIAIVQTGPEKEALKTVYLAELLNLSMDQPTNLYRFNTKEAARKLLASPLIKDASISKISPGTLYIDYTVRQPVAFLAEVSNTAIDEEGYPFPFKPFFTPKILPEIVLGTSWVESYLKDDTERNGALCGQRAQLALELLRTLSEQYQPDTCRISRIDVSKAYASSCGQRQIVISLEEKIEVEKEGKQILCLCPRILRISTKNAEEGLANYLYLRKLLREEIDNTPSLTNAHAVKRSPEKIIDLRIPRLGYMTK